MGIITNLVAGGGGAIPEQTITGLTNYTIPLGKYGYLFGSLCSMGQINANSSNDSDFSSHAGYYAIEYDYDKSEHDGGQKTVNLFLTEGDTISTSISAPTNAMTVAGANYQLRCASYGFAKLLVNGNIISQVYGFAKIISLVSPYKRVSTRVISEVSFAISLFNKE